MNEKLKLIHKKIVEAESKGNIPLDLYREQLNLLHSAHNEFIKKAQMLGYDLDNNLDILEIEIKQFTAMKQVAAKLGDDTQEYDILIKKARIRVFGEEAVGQYFS